MIWKAEIVDSTDRSIKIAFDLLKPYGLSTIEKMHVDPKDDGTGGYVCWFDTEAA